MDTLPIITPSLKLVPRSRKELLAWVETLPPEVRVEISPDWLARLHDEQSADPWTLGFSIVRLADAASVGQCGFKGPPNADGLVEIAYGIDPPHQGRGYATEAATAMTTYALRSAQVRRVIAHTLPEQSASTRVLAKSGYRNIGEVVDPEDGLVWRWEYDQQSSGSP